jgi:hypothetical protein
MATLGQIPSKTRLTTSLAATTTVLPRLHDTQPAVLLYSSQADPNPQAQGCSLLNVAPKAPHAVRQRSALSEPSTLFNSSMLVTGTPPRGLSGPGLSKNKPHLCAGEVTGVPYRCTVTRATQPGRSHVPAWSPFLS